MTKSSPLNHQSWELPPELASAVEAEMSRWQAQDKTRRLWARDATLWTGSDEANWLGWLDLTAVMQREIPALQAFSTEVQQREFSHAVLMGMGGSSLCPEVLANTFGQHTGFPEMLVLDSTDPAQVASIERRVQVERTLFIVASKSGTTIEPNMFLQYFFDRVKQRAGFEKAGQHFVAITDPGSQLQKVAERDGFWKVFFGIPSVGGRYSALSNFGLVPAAAMGVDVKRFLSTAHRMAEACGATVPVKENPGVALGILLGVLARMGRDKLTLVKSPWRFGAWVEQLVAESTGKNGLAIIPVDEEPLEDEQVYGADRVFVSVERPSGDARSAAPPSLLTSWFEAKHPVVRIALQDKYALGQELFRWEVATAVAGAILGIHPFNQPDVEASKIETRKLTFAYESSGFLPAEAFFFQQGGIKLFADERNAAAITNAAGSPVTLERCLRGHLQRLARNDYFALLAYVEMNSLHTQLLQEIRRSILQRFRVATCLGFGPRFLHSTGQAYKGGPNTGVFLQITCDDAADLPVPGQKYTFGVVKAAQARGDFEVLAARNRRALRIHLGPDVEKDLRVLLAAVQAAVS